jgi:molybdate transport system substrate-binding protein
MMNCKAIGALLVFWVGGLAQAEEFPVAVAANFSAPVQAIVQAFEQGSSHKVRVSVGSTGQFYAQIKSGAPFQILLAADESTPVKLEQEGAAVAGSRFTYARGKLVLWSPQPGRVDAQGEVLKTQQGADGQKLSKLAIADPRLAPYGQAAVEVLNHLGLMAAWQAQLVMGGNIGQAYQYVATQNAPLGFVALSQVWRDGRLSEGSAWLVPQALYNPIKQDAVLLNPGKGHAGAQAFLDFLQTEKARQIMRGFGYD